MSEPTIDEMIAWLDGLRPARMREVTAIRAILEQHRPMERGKGLLLMHPNDIDRGKLEAIRAFVERVEARLIEDIGPHQLLGTVNDYRSAVRDELAAMEEEAEQ